MASSGSCLDCIHFERMYRTCKYDAPAGAKRGAASRRRIQNRTDVRTYRCEDFLSWEVGLLPFVKPESAESPDETVSAETAPSR